MNFIHGTIAANSFRTDDGIDLPLAGKVAARIGEQGTYGIRPEHFTIADDGAEAEIVVVEPTGSETQVFAKLGGEQVVAVFRERHQFNPGDMIRLKPDPSLVHLFDQDTGRRL
jgi:multiple sugar transport system ATP-binding protein